MAEPTPIGTKRRHYTRRQKLAAVIAADMVGVVEGAKQSGIPATTIEYWMHKPEFVAIRSKTREELADEIKVAAHLAWKRIVETAPMMEPRDAIFAAEKATEMLQLLSGEATSRNEIRDITAQISDHEWDQLTSILREAAEEVEA